VSSADALSTAIRLFEAEEAEAEEQARHASNKCDDAAATSVRVSVGVGVLTCGSVGWFCAGAGNGDAPTLSRPCQL
jgi:hypothetical protein